LNQSGRLADDLQAKYSQYEVLFEAQPFLTKRKEGRKKKEGEGRRMVSDLKAVSESL